MLGLALKTQTLKGERVDTFALKESDNVVNMRLNVDNTLKKNQ